jgi:hypothetical protein
MSLLNSLETDIKIFALRPSSFLFFAYLYLLAHI